MALPFKYGFEHETAFLRGGEFADFYNTSRDDFQAIIDPLPRFESDYSMLRIGDAGIKVKRWYVEGFERFDEDGRLLAFVPRGVELRTVPADSIAEARASLERDFARMLPAAAERGFSPAWIAHNPFRSELVLDPPLNAYERRRTEDDPAERTGYRTIYTFGPDLNLSSERFSDADLVDIVRKLTYYSPYILPFSFSSPFFEGVLWEGYSVRTFIRTGDRHAARVFLRDTAFRMPEKSPMTVMARIPAEAGRIEFKAFDALADFTLYAALMALVKGIILSELPERLDWPDKPLHQHVAKTGFDDDMVFKRAWGVLDAAHAALAGDPDQAYLDRLKDMLERRFTPAKALIDDFHKTDSILETLRNSYEKFTI